MRCVVVFAAVAVFLTGSNASASIWITSGGRSPQLRVDARGYTEVS